MTPLLTLLATLCGDARPLTPLDALHALPWTPGRVVHYGDWNGEGANDVAFALARLDRQRTAEGAGAGAHGPLPAGGAGLVIDSLLGVDAQSAPRGRLCVLAPDARARATHVAGSRACGGALRFEL